MTNADNNKGFTVNRELLTEKNKKYLIKMKVRFIPTINLITILILIPSNETQILNLPK